MKAVMVIYDEDLDTITENADVEPQPWIDVCEKYNDDVHRLRDVADIGIYTGLYECIDDYNKKFYYIVEEDKNLYRLKRRNFYKSLGL